MSKISFKYFSHENLMYTMHNARLHIILNETVPNNKLIYCAFKHFHYKSIK